MDQAAVLGKLDEWMPGVSADEDFVIRNMAEIIGVAIGVKTVAMDLFTPSELERVDLREFRKMLHGLGVHVVFERRALGGNDPMNFAQYYFLGLSHENAVAAQSLFHKIWNGEWEMNREIGGLLGYPQTAVDYFLERDEALDSELDKARNKRNRFYIHSPEHENEEFAAYEAKIYQVINASCPNTARMLAEDTGKRAR